jgi:energy-coupling factor transport system substrate-specific component
MKTSYWSTREYVFAAMTAAALLVVASIIIPLTLPLRIPGLANSINGFFGAFFLTIALIRLRRPGSLLLITGIYALICLSVSPLVFGFILIGGLFGETVCFLLFRGYPGKLAPVCGAVLYEMGMFPAAMLLSFFFFPENYRQVAAWIFVIAETAIFITSTLGALLGLKVAKELARAGKLQLEVA